MPAPLPAIAIAGAWGYIGRKLLDAAIELGRTVYAFDPGPMPDDLDRRRVLRIEDEREFYDLTVDFFHLALHPGHRRKGLARLFERSRRERIVVLIEKPMALPECPSHCQRVIDAATGSSAVVLYDFPELFDPLTRRITDFLATFDRVEVSEIFVQRSKDREDPDNPRNTKQMVSIQYQESVHCLAFVVHLLATQGRCVDSVFANGLDVQAVARPYHAPNPDAYAQPVDGYCKYSLGLGNTRIDGVTDFTRRASWTKRRIIRGLGDGRPFEIDAEYLEGSKGMRIDGKKQPFDPTSCSYQAIIREMQRWSDGEDASERAGAVRPDARFAQITYQLSSLLWASSHRGQRLALASLDDLVHFQAGFPG